MSLDSTFQAAITGPVVYIFVAIEILHPVRTIRLLDGPGQLTIDGNVFKGVDDNVGSLDEVTLDQEGGASQASMQVSILPSSMANGVALAVPAAQGAAATMIVGAYDPTTMTVVGVPDKRFIGEIDTIDLTRGNSGNGDVALHFEIVSAFENLFEADEGLRMGSSSHKSIWGTGELAFDYMTLILDTIPWGKEGVVPLPSAPAVNLVNSGNSDLNTRISGYRRNPRGMIE